MSTPNIERVRKHLKAALEALGDEGPAIPAVIPAEPPKVKAPAVSPKFILNGKTFKQFIGGLNFPEEVAEHTVKCADHAGRQNVLRMEIKRGDPQWNNPGDLKDERRRAEFTWRKKGKGLRFGQNEDAWSSFWVFLPSNPMEKIRGCTIAQWHNHPDRGEMMQIVLDDGWLYAGGKNSKGDKFNIGHKARLENYLDRWVQITTRARGKNGKGGLVQIWIDGEKFAEKRGSLKSESRFGPYFKNGLYFWDYEDDKVKRALAYFDNVAIGPTRESVEIA